MHLPPGETESSLLPLLPVAHQQLCGRCGLKVFSSHPIMPMMTFKRETAFCRNGWNLHDSWWPCNDDAIEKGTPNKLTTEGKITSDRTWRTIDRYYKSSYSSSVRHSCLPFVKLFWVNWLQEYSVWTCPDDSLEVESKQNSSKSYSILKPWFSPAK